MSVISNSKCVIISTKLNTMHGNNQYIPWQQHTIYNTIYSNITSSNNWLVSVFVLSTLLACVNSIHLCPSLISPLLSSLTVSHSFHFLSLSQELIIHFYFL